jgi:protein subunit release factor A
MLNLLNFNYQNKGLKSQISEIFPEISKCTLSSIYSETLRGQIRPKKFQKIESGCRKYNKKLTCKNNKSYIIKLPNLLENICSEEINHENLESNICQVEKALKLLFKEHSQEFTDNHLLVFIMIWDIVGRFQKIAFDDLFTQYNELVDIEKWELELILKDLSSIGVIKNINNNLGISPEIKLH